MSGGRDRVAPRGRSPRGEPLERAGAGRRAEGAATRARGGGCDVVPVAAGGTARRGGSAGTSKEAGMGNVDRPGRFFRQESPGRSAHRGQRRHCHLRGGPCETGQGLPGAAIDRDGGWGPLGSRLGPAANAGNRERALSSRAARTMWRWRCGSRAARRAIGSVLTAGRQSRPDRTGERPFGKGIVTRMGGNPRAGFRSARPTRAPVPSALSIAKREGDAPVNPACSLEKDG